MMRKVISMFALVTAISVVMTGCSGNNESMSMVMEKPVQPAQMKSLEKFVGRWSGTAEFAPATAEKMRKAMPVSDTGERAQLQTTFAGGSEGEWVLDGMTLRHKGWYEMGEGKKKEYVELWTWNANKGKYRVVAMDNWGGYAEGWATPNARGESFEVVMTETDLAGNRVKGSGTITFTDRNTMQWTWQMNGPDGRMEFVGTSRRS